MCGWVLEADPRGWAVCCGLWVGLTRQDEESRQHDTPRRWDWENSPLPAHRQSLPDPPDSESHVDLHCATDLDTDPYRGSRFAHKVLLVCDQLHIGWSSEVVRNVRGGVPRIRIQLLPAILGRILNGGYKPNGLCIIPGFRLNGLLSAARRASCHHIIRESGLDQGMTDRSGVKSDEVEAMLHLHALG